MTTGSPRDPLLVPLAGLTAGILVSAWIPFDLRESAIAAGVAFTVWLAAVWMIRRGRARRAYGTLTALLLYALAGTLLDALHRKGPAPKLDAESGEWVLLGGCVINPPVFHQDRGQFLLELEPGAVAQVTMYTKEGEPPPALRYGQRIEVESKIRRPRNFRNPGAFDYQSYLARRDIHWLASTHTSPKIDVLPGECGTPLGRIVSDMRTRALDRLAALYPNDAYTEGMMAAVLTGQTQRLDRIWTEDFRRTGTYHALVVSGMHFTAIVFLLWMVVRLTRAGRGLHLLAGIVAGWSYTALCGWSPPVVRAAGMLTLFLIGRWLFRRARLLNLMAGTAILYLAWDPGQLFEPSFQLSFAAVAALGFFAEPLIESTTGPYVNGLRNLYETTRDLRAEPKVAEFRIEMRLLAETAALWLRVRPRWIEPLLTIPLRGLGFAWELLSVSALMQVTLLAPMVLYFHRVSLSGWTANLLVVPLMNLSVPSGLIALATGWEFPAAIAKLCLEWSAAVAKWQANWALERAVPDPPAWLIAAFTFALIATAWSVRRRNLWRVPALAASLATAGTLAAYEFAPLAEHGKLELTVVDVGQGDSVFVSFPDGKRMLMDGGGLLSFNRQRKPQIDTGQDVVAPYLWTRRMPRVDVIASSHAHEDHTGGLPSLIDVFSPREIWTGANPVSETWTAVIGAAERVKAPVRSFRAGERFPYGGATIEILSPPEDYEPARTPKNNDSLVLLIEHGQTRFLLSGDMEREMEWRIVESGRLPKIDVLKVAHHGSKTSTTAEFLEAAQPRFALISAGEGNLFKHPHPSVVERLEAAGTHILRTDRNGLIRVVSDGRRIEIHTPGSHREDFE